MSFYDFLRYVLLLGFVLLSDAFINGCFNFHQKENMKKLSIILFAGLLFINLGCSFLTAEEYIVVRVNANYAPFEMVVGGELTGLHIDLVYTIAQRLNIEVNFRSVPWKRAIRMVETGEAAAITYIGRTPERERFAYFNDGNILSSSSYAFVILKSRADEIQYNGDLQRLQNYTIGVQHGYSYGTVFDQADYLKKHTVRKAFQMALMLKNRRLDLGIIDEPEFLQKQHTLDWKDLVLLRPVLVKRDFYIAFSKAKKLQNLTKHFGKELKSFKQTQEYLELLAKYKLN